MWNKKKIKRNDDSKETGDGMVKKNPKKKNQDKKLSACAVNKKAKDVEIQVNVKLGIMNENRYNNNNANVGRAKGDYAPTSISQLSAIEDNFSLSIGSNDPQQPACPSQ